MLKMLKKSITSKARRRKENLILRIRPSNFAWKQFENTHKVFEDIMQEAGRCEAGQCEAASSEDAKPEDAKERDFTSTQETKSSRESTKVSPKWGRRSKFSEWFRPQCTEHDIKNITSASIHLARKRTFGVVPRPHTSIGDQELYCRPWR
jgi:hypothetical protein